jgi:lipoprotein-anchoring transpeptidase ErfK/SrfK
MRGILALTFLFCLAVVDTDAKKRPSSTRNRVAEPAPFDAAAVANPLTRGDGEAAVLRAQILLDRAHFSAGEIDGRQGKNFERALAAFQTSRKLPFPGPLDEPTWVALNVDTAPPLAPYTITAADVAGPFVKVPNDLVDQSKLESLGYQSALEALAEQFHVNPALLKRMNPGRRFAEGEEILVPNVLTAPVMKAAKVVVTKAGTVQALDDADNVIAHYPASSGSEHDPLPIGTWKINGVARNPPFHYNPKLFWDANPKHSKAKIAAGPNNPVGVVWIDLSKDHYGIHGTPEPSKVGHTQSHGCIRLTNWDANELASLVGPGIPAVLKE